MSSGPIEFLSDEPDRHVPATEYGGADGLIQPEWPGGFEGEGQEGHTVNEKESLGIRARRANVPLMPREGSTGEVVGDEVVDPVTGRVVPVDLVSGDVTGDGGTLSDLKP